MFSVHDIVHHMITGKPYIKNTSQDRYIGSQSYKLLEEATTKEIIEKVRNFVNDNLPEEVIYQEINNENAYLYLAAAKIIDMDTHFSEMSKSTFRIREMALVKSKPEQNRNEINLLNAFSIPSVDYDDVDLFLINELDNVHPLIINSQTKNIHLKRIYNYSQNGALIIPEIISLIENIVAERLKAIIDLTSVLPKETLFIYKGCSGAGKSFALRKFIKKNLKSLSLEEAVQSTDHIKLDIRAKTNFLYSDQQVHLLGGSIFKILVNAIQEYYPKFSFIQEGWFNNYTVIDSLFEHLNSNNLKLQIKDFDGEFVAICLRLLARYQDANSPKPPLSQIEYAYKTSRETRNYLLMKLRESDSYKLKFVNAKGIISHINAKNIEYSFDEINNEIEHTKNLHINESHVLTFGNYLNAFIGMTIEEAFHTVR